MVFFSCLLEWSHLMPYSFICVLICRNSGNRCLQWKPNIVACSDQVFDLTALETRQAEEFKLNVVTEQDMGWQLLPVTPELQLFCQISGLEKKRHKTWCFGFSFAHSLSLSLPVCVSMCIYVWVTSSVRQRTKKMISASPYFSSKEMMPSDWYYKSLNCLLCWKPYGISVNAGHYGDYARGKEVFWVYVW